MSTLFANVVDKCGGLTSIISAIVIKWCNGKLIDYCYLASGKINIIYKIKVETNITKEFILRIRTYVNTDFLQNDCMERYLNDIFKENKNIKYPRVYFFDDSKEIIPYSYSVIEFINGITLDKDPNNNDYYKCGKKLSELHKYKVCGYGNWTQKPDINAIHFYDEYYEKTLRNLKKYSNDMYLKFSSELNKYYNHKDLLNCNSILLHHDFHPKNIIVTKEDIYFIDWDSTRGGIKEYDLIKFVFFNIYNKRKDALANFFQGYQSEGDLNINYDFGIYVMCWLSRMYIFERQVEENNIYYPIKDFYLKWFDILDENFKDIFSCNITELNNRLQVLL